MVSDRGPSTLKSVEDRLDALERDMRALKRPRQSVAPSPGSLNDDYDDVPFLDAAEIEEDESSISPGGTDGVGTIEFSVEQGSTFFGERNWSLLE